MVRLRGPLVSLDAHGWLGGNVYKRRGVNPRPYPISVLPVFYSGYRYPAFGFRPVPGFISAYYSLTGWIYEQRRTWHGLQPIAKRYGKQPFRRTSYQVSQRTKFCLGYTRWNTFTYLQKGIWKSYAVGRRMTGYDLFMRYFLRGKGYT